MKRLYLVRHCETMELLGESPTNPRGDSPLSPEGMEQARRLAQFLGDWPVDLVLTSLYPRAVQTAQVVTREREVPVHASLALNELLPRGEESEEETMEQGLERGLEFLDQFRPHHENILVVGHNAILSALRASLLDAPDDAGYDYFADPGRCCVLRNDPDAGDEAWSEVATFAP